MITELDESLLHQGPETFAHALVSDHRFYDRTVLGLQSPDGALDLLVSFAIYKNNNVMDGFAALQSDGRRQYNHRFSRSLQPDFRLVLGPLSLEVTEPLRRLRARLAPGDYPGSFDFEWCAVLPPHEEDRHALRLDGRLVRDYIRFDQFASASGWITLEGKRTDFSDWFAWRDHSWGVRPGVGGFEPFTGSREADTGHLLLVIWWLTDTEGGQFLLEEDGDGNRRYLDGRITFRSDRPSLQVVDAQHDITFVTGTRVFDQMRVVLTAGDGSNWNIEAQALGRPWAYKGTGYDHGYNDEKGLGVWRAPWLEEYDTYDISHPEAVKLPDGRVIRPLHREQCSRVTVNGRPGFAHIPFFISGPVKCYGFAGGGEDLPG